VARAPSRNRVHPGEGSYGRNKTSFDPETNAKVVYTSPEEPAALAVIPELRIIPDTLRQTAQAAMERSARKVAQTGSLRAAR
jgi:hypothetical protein